MLAPPERRVLQSRSVAGFPRALIGSLECAPAACAAKMLAKHPASTKRVWNASKPREACDARTGESQADQSEASLWATVAAHDWVRPSSDRWT